MALAPRSTQPEKYSTFFSVPCSNANANARFDTPFPTGAIAGKYASGTGAYTYTDTSVSTSWYDMAVSSDGPAAIMRIVIDVADVTGADTSSGFGSVYFSTTGLASVTDIEVADITVNVTHAYADSGSSSLTGSFYVKGKCGKQRSDGLQTRGGCRTSRHPPSLFAHDSLDRLV